jgi:hypothetical protein
MHETTTEPSGTEFIVSTTFAEDPALVCDVSKNAAFSEVLV